MAGESHGEWRHIERVVGVYQANGGIVGEVAYVTGKLLGRAHCSLCDITHSPLRRKGEWDAFVASLPVPLDVVHLNERDETVLAATEGRTPCVVALVNDGAPRMLIEAATLEGLAGSVDRFADALRTAVLDLAQALEPAPSPDLSDGHS